jgi:hypothetical protein
MNEFNLSWWEEKVEKVPSKNWLYKIICFFLRRKLTYKELYVFYIEINNGNSVEESAKPIKKRCFEEILNVYSFNNNKIPKEMEYYVGE